jgi:(+)-neomenthol dehydrogenase
MQLSGMDMDQRLGWLWINCRDTYETAKEGLRINYYGTKHVTETLLPLCKPPPMGGSLMSPPTSGS